MRRTVAVWIGLVVAVTVAGADEGVAGFEGGARWGGGEHPRMEAFGARRMERVAALLDLNEQQIQEWHLLHEGRAESMRAQHLQLRVLREQIDEAVGVETPDASAIGQLVLAAHEVRAEGKAVGEQVHSELMLLLTPEQQQHFELMRDLRPERGRRGRHGKFHDFGFRGASELD